MGYTDIVLKFQLFMKANGYDTHQDRHGYALGGAANEGYRPVCINFPLFNYDKIREIGFFDDQKNYDMSICRTTDSKREPCVQIYILLKDLYSDQLCQESEFITILNKIKNMKQKLFLN